MDAYIDPHFKPLYQQYPLVLADVGARGGIPKNWEPARDFLQVIGFEPDLEEYQKLTSSVDAHKIKYLNTGLYSEEGLLNFYLTVKPGCSSLIEPNHPFLDQFHAGDWFSVSKIIQLKVEKFDNLVLEYDIPDVDFIKLDTQGTELFILEGARNCIRDHVMGLEIEVEFAPIYKAQPLFSDIDVYVRKMGFHLFDLRTCHWKRRLGGEYGNSKGQLIHGDALYLRELDSQNQLLNRYSDPSLKKAKVLKSLSICVLYGYLDYAFSIFERQMQLFTLHEAELVKKSFEHEVYFRRKLPVFRGRLRLSLFFSKLAKILDPSSTRFSSVSGRSVGNFD